MNADIKREAVRFKVARGNLALAFALTAVNIFLLAFDAGWHLFFSAFVPQAIMYFFIYAGVIGVGLVVALLAAGTYFVCWLLSKRWRVFMLVALILFSIDSLIFFILALGMFAGGGFTFGDIIQAVIQIWILYYLIIGTIAWARLRKVSADDVAVAQQEADDAESAVLQKDAMNDIAGNDGNSGDSGSSGNSENTNNPS